MDLIDRYVQRVRFFLPRRQQDDIARELAADLRAEIQDREIELGHPLDPRDLRGILKRWGHPILVAGRYQPTQYLIGPALLPIYVFVLKLVTAVYLIPWLVVWIGLVIFSASYRSAHPGLAMMGPLSTWWSLVFGVVGTVTVVFALLERSQGRVFERWDPNRLPTVRDRNAISRFSSIAEAIAGTVFILWWTGCLQLPILPDRAGALVATPTASFNSFHWPILCQATAAVLLAGVNLFRPWWTFTRALVRLALNLAVAVIAALMLQAGPWMEISVGRTSVPASEAITAAANIGVYWLLLGIGLISFLVACLEDSRRLYRLITRTPSTE
jgi:hypothetical protein